MKGRRYCYLNKIQTKLLFLGTLLFLFNSLSVHSQTSKIPLTQFIEEIESTYDISFSYADEFVSDVFIVPLKEGLTLQQALDLLQQETNLKVEKISDKYFALTKQEEPLMVCGYLIDIESRYPIGLATVKHGANHTISDSTGYFELSFEKGQNLNIQHLSYESISSEPKQGTDCGTIYLIPKLQILPEILIPDYLVSGIDKMANGQLYVSTKDLQILPGLIEPDVLFSLQAFPGISSFKESVADINIRGGTNDQNLVLWDGVRMYQTGHFFGLISAFNPYAVDRVSITKNGTSAQFGDAVSGLLQINSTTEIAKEFQAQGGFNLLNTDLVINTPITKGTSVQISARRSISDLFDSPTFESYSDRAFRDTEILSTDVDTINFSNESFQYYDFNVKVNSKLSDKDRVSLSMIQIGNELEHEESGFVNGEEEFKQSTLKQNSVGYGLQYSRNWNKTTQSNIQLNMSEYDLESINFDIENSQRLLQQNEVSDISLKFNQSFRINDLVQLNGGYQFNEITVGNLEDLDNPEFRRYIKEIIQNHTLYSEIDYLSADMKTQAKVGLRMNNYVDIDRTTIEPRLSFNHQLSDAIAVEVLGESKSQSLVQVIDLQNDFLGVEKRRWVLVDEDDIPLLTSTQGSIGLQYNLSGWMFTVDGYMKQVDGIITSSQAFQNQFELVRESGSYLVKGIELLFNKKIERFSGWVSYTFSENEYVFTPLNTPKFTSNLDIPHQLTLGLGYKDNHLQLSTNVNWRSGSPFTNPGDPTIIGGRINYLNPNTERQDDYLRVDFSGKYWFNIGDNLVGEFGVAFWNLTGRENKLNTYFRNEGLSGARRIENLALGFTPNVMARIRFR